MPYTWDMDSIERDLSSVAQARVILDALLQREWNLGLHPWACLFTNQEWYQTLDQINALRDHPDMVRV